MRYFVILAGLAVAACQTETPNDVITECTADGYSSLVGSHIGAVTLPRDLNHRIIGPDTMVTMDYIPERVNFYTDKDGIIEKVSCG